MRQQKFKNGWIVLDKRTFWERLRDRIKYRLESVVMVLLVITFMMATAMIFFWIGWTLWGFGISLTGVMDFIWILTGAPIVWMATAVFVLKQIQEGHRIRNMKNVYDPVTKTWS